MFAVLVLVAALRLELKAGVPAFDSVITMLNNLVQQIDAEQTADDADFHAFEAWFTEQRDTTTASVGMLQNRLQELTAVLADLRSRQGAHSQEVAALLGEISQCEGQIGDATAKRTEEKEKFVQEQLDFDNAVAACGKAVEILSLHYGDGQDHSAGKPAWMSLIAELGTAKSTRVAQVRAFLQSKTPTGSSMSDTYVDKTDEGLNIVGQVRDLTATFSDDKESSLDQENQLASAFSNLMGQKQANHATLVQQRDSVQAMLTQVSQELGEAENGEATAKATMADSQTYLGQINQQNTDTTAMYQQRVADRAGEKEAVNSAMAVLNTENPALMQVRGARQGLVLKKKATALKRRLPAAPVCSVCHLASVSLQKKAQALRSELLATAAMTSGSGEALQPVVEQLHEMVARLVEQQHAEEQHKSWCEHEMSETAATKSHHEALVAELQTSIADLTAVREEKKQGIADTAEQIADADKAYAEIKAVRAQAKTDYEMELRDYRDAIEALNQAVDILASFYREQFLQVKVSSGRAPVGGTGVVSALTETRTDFQRGLEHIEAQEKEQVSDFETGTDAHDKSRADMVDAGNRLNAALQSTELALTRAQEDLGENNQKVASATSYLSQVGGSCDTLIAHFADRSQLRSEEKTAINDAITILQAAA